MHTLLLELLLAGGISGTVPSLDLVVDGVTCASCAVSIRSVLKQAHLSIRDLALHPPYARVQVALTSRTDLEKAFSTLTTIGYPVFVVLPDADGEEETPEAVRRVLVGKDTVWVLPAKVWLEKHAQHKEEGS